ncbi:small subunit ribosomal protein S1 [Lachnospiraceae bacterium NE2001]|nr:small subunit ribosomal protein S1 [Lachnospiraceae bacterium NE2001]
MEESMKDYEQMLEESYSLMGDGVHDTDTLLAWRKAEELKESQENITVTVSEVVKGGVVADFEGIRAFIPISKLSLERIDDCNPFLGKELEVRVFEANMDEDKLILSAKEILKEQQELSRKKKISDVKVGQVYHGTVSSIKDYGAFIDLPDGLSGLVHISQISHKRIKHPKVVLKEGQEVDVKVIDIKDGKISLSIKALLDNAESQEAEDAEVVIPESESIGTSLGDLLDGFKFD